ncbi:MAG TPA: hypothetical protein VN903_15370 [Polyangia bacterium]|jgi:hypothetical protein|nr:hypothetical protein [Polyangia bacterium]
MNRPDQPAANSDRLLASDATAFERRVLEAAQQQKPSAASSARMARALGVTVATLGTATTATTLAAGAAATKAAAAGATAVWSWITVGVVGLVVAGAVVGTRVARHPSEPPVVVAPVVAAPVTPPPEPTIIPEARGPRPEAPTANVPTHAVASPRPRAITTAGDLSAEVALIDSARAAVSAGAARNALDLLRRYQDKYPAGSFRPEATAIRIEALMKLGRETEARALAERFVAENRGSLLARRVADVAGLSRP